MFYEIHNCRPNFRSGNRQLSENMPTVRWFPRGPEYRYYFSCFERFGMAKTSAKYKKAIAVLMLILSRKRRSGKLTAHEKRRKMMLIMGCMHRIKRINAEITKKAVYVYRPPQGVVPRGVEDSFWDDDLFNTYFRFRKHEFLRILHAMHLSGKYILCGRKNKAQYFPADICMMVLKRTLLLILAGLPIWSWSLVFHRTGCVISIIQW